jgi:hypothetical protein
MSKTRNLGNLTDVLSAGSTYATATTPLQFDNSTNLATTAALVRQGIQASSYTGLAGTTTLTVAQAGGTINLGGTGNYTVTLPLTSTLVIGTRYEFECNIGSSGIGTIARQGSTDTIYAGGGGSGLTSLAMGPGDTLTLEYVGGNTWLALGGSVQLGYSNAFASSFASAGYQKLPSGLILQWGTSSTASGSAAVAFPIAFTSLLFALSVCEWNGAGGWTNTNASFYGCYGQTLSQFSVRQANITGGAMSVNSSGNFVWMAVGK